MSVVVVCFPGAPKVSEEAVKKEEELDKYLETRVEGELTPPAGSSHFHPLFFSPHLANTRSGETSKGETHKHFKHNRFRIGNTAAPTTFFFFSKSQT